MIIDETIMLIIFCINLIFLKKIKKGLKLSIIFTKKKLIQKHLQKKFE